jgi:dihydroorotate dehydrogenase (NAD+) catalytic subunit
LDAYIRDDLPRIGSLQTSLDGERVAVPLITNVMGSTEAELSELVRACEEQPLIAAIELNVSCPNVATGLDIGADPEVLRQVVASLRPLTDKPLIVKLTPNTADVAACALGAERGGADAVSLINTLKAMALTPVSRGGERSDAGRSPGPARPWHGGGTGGLSGPALRPVALAQVAAVARVLSIPIVGMGGIQSAAHARDLLAVGATLVGVGTESFRDPLVGMRIGRELTS